jgi:hypothetical protein
VVSDALVAAHHRAVEIIRSWGGPQVGWAVATQSFQPEPGAEEEAAAYAYPRETRFLEEARADDWLGVQAYTRTTVGPDHHQRHPGGGRRGGVEAVADRLRVVLPTGQRLLDIVGNRWHRHRR